MQPFLLFEELFAPIDLPKKRSEKVAMLFPCFGNLITIELGGRKKY